MCCSFRCKFITSCNNTSANKSRSYLHIIVCCCGLEFQFLSVPMYSRLPSWSTRSTSYVPNPPSPLGYNNIDLATAICLHSCKIFYSPISWEGGGGEERNEAHIWNSCRINAVIHMYHCAGRHLQNCIHKWWRAKFFLSFDKDQQELLHIILHSFGMVHLCALGPH